MPIDTTAPEQPVPENENQAQFKEQEFVHDVYEEIATHFSDTRYKPWPVVERFLLDLQPGFVGLDVGCGNGKYMSVNPNVCVFASDRSEGLVGIACDRHVGDRSELSKKTKIGSLQSVSEASKALETPSEAKKHLLGTDAMISDGLTLPFPHSRFDFVISIAVIHHFSTKERRVQAVQEILSRLRPNPLKSSDSSAAKALIYVWALEQEKSRRGYHEGMEQDVLVPWVMQKNQAKKPKEKKPRPQKNKKGQQPEPQVQSQDVSVETEKKEEPSGVVRHRYYHLYKQGELEEDVKVAGGRVLESGYSKDNWYAIITRDD